MTTILVIGASGFVGRRLAQTLLADGHGVRCLVRDLAKIADLAAAGAEVVRGDITDAASVDAAMAGVGAVYISIHTLSAQPAAAGRGFMDVETIGIGNIVAAAQAHDVRRVIYVTSTGVAPGGPGAWLRGRARTERILLDSGLDATVIGPGQIVGRGGRGFDTILANAKRRVAFVVGGGRLRLRSIGIDDLVYYLVGVRDEPRAFGRRFDVGSDDVLTIREMIDVAADVLGRPHPLKVTVPRAVLAAVAPLIERAAKMPRGGIRGLLDSLDTDDVGDPAPIRLLLPRPLLSYREAACRAIEGG